MEYVNLRFKWKEGKFYESSNTAKEGFEKVTYSKIGNNGAKEEKVTYHKFYDEVKGVISSVKIDKSPYGTNLAVNVKTDKEQITQIKLPLNSKVSYSEEAKAMISSLKGYETGEEVSIKPYVKTFKKNNGSDGKNVTIFINYVNKLDDNGKSLSTGYINFEDVPKWEKKEVRGVEEWNADAEMNYYYSILNEVMGRFDAYWASIKSESAKKDSTQSVPKATKSSTKSVTKEPTSAMQPNENFGIEEFDEDELPF